MTTSNKWIVGTKGGDDVLQQFVVSRPARSGGLSAREWIMMDKDRVRIFTCKIKAQKAADLYNKRGF